MLIDFYELAMKRLGESKNLLEERITSGGLQSYEEYRFLCGQLIENKKNQEILKTIIKSYHN
jgi:hypothetical protein